MKIEYSVKDIGAPAENIFNLAVPDAYECRVHEYMKGHSVLVLYICSFKKERLPEGAVTKFYAIFEVVEYYQGPMWWNGANFRTSSINEYLRLLHILRRETLSLSPDIPDYSHRDPQTVAGRMFIVEKEDFQIKIIATVLTTVDDISKYPIK